MTTIRPVIPLYLILAILGCDEADDVEKPVSVLRGVITDEAAMPVPDAQVFLEVWDGSNSSLEERDRSDSTGAYEVILGVEPIAQTWVFAKVGYATEEFAIPEDATIVAPRSYRLDVTLTVPDRSQDTLVNKTEASR